MVADLFFILPRFHHAAAYEKFCEKPQNRCFFFSHRRRKLCSHRDLGSFVVDNDIKGLSMHDSKQITRMISAALNFLSNYRISGKKMGN